MYTRGAYALTPWALRDRNRNAVPPGQVLPPSIPGRSKTYRRISLVGASPWARRCWAGMVPSTLAPAGGVVVTPQPDAGTVFVQAWWPSARYLQLVRVRATGQRSLVRNAAPVTMTLPTRRNSCTNPSLTTGLSGYVPGTGNPTLSLVPRDAGSAWRITSTASGTSEVTVPGMITPAQTVTVGVDLRASTRPSAITIRTTWATSTGAALPDVSVSLSADAINRSVNQWARQVVTLAAPNNAASGALKVSASFAATGATLDGDSITVEAAATDGSAFDGDTLGGQWDGATALSSSTFAPVASVTDGECPLDTPVTYELYATDSPGGHVVSDPVTLASNGSTWLTHPATPTTPLSVRPTTTPNLVRAMTQGVYPILGSRYPIVVNDSVRQAPTGTLTLDCNGWTERDAILALLADGSPLLLRTPVGYGYPHGMWLALGDATEDAGGRSVDSASRTLAVPFTQVTTPAALNLVAA